MQAAEKLALRDPPPLRARPTKKPSGTVSGLLTLDADLVPSPGHVGRTRAVPSAWGGATPTKVAARVALVARDSYGIRLLLRGRLTEVRLSEQPPEVIAAKTIAIAHRQVLGVRDGVTIRVIAGIVRKTATARHTVGDAQAFQLKKDRNSVLSRITGGRIKVQIAVFRRIKGVYCPI